MTKGRPSIEQFSIYWNSAQHIRPQHEARGEKKQKNPVVIRHSLILWSMLRPNFNISKMIYSLKRLRKTRPNIEVCPESLGVKIMILNWSTLILKVGTNKGDRFLGLAPATRPWIVSMVSMVWLTLLAGVKNLSRYWATVRYRKHEPCL